MLVGKPLSEALNLETEQMSAQLLTAMVEIGSLEPFIFTGLMNEFYKMHVIAAENICDCSKVSLNLCKPWYFMDMVKLFQ